jgi:16S rRNA (guanine527-N7)-methyltransferase
VTPQAIANLLQPYTAGIPEPQAGWPHVCGQLALYLDLILKWNARTNLTAIRTPDDIVRRHFGESLFAGAHLGECATLLDFGSGAGFPGIPIQLLRPDIQVTLGESQGKKAAFLREVCRDLRLSTKVFSARVETMPGDLQFDVVTLRAVDNMNAAIPKAARQAKSRILILTTQDAAMATVALLPFQETDCIALPESDRGVLKIFRRALFACSTWNI